ncbi:FadR family transcriptional regulator [Achromobacter sp. GG226]|uniref:FadR/GntR family transcriptional regulator n=1 Tax=Verticiella alkaliphila TaxID=2779529 RepID=UPI001C0AB1BF|nr:FCD domain-containing protein [Verticiella sp. GG226]MBU4612144.1 FadR family transcriptional regulator [Verticiella sp. GG226]
MPDAAALLEDYLLQNLHAGRWQPGERLPTERELGERFSLGRTAVRGVLAVLKTRGLIAQRVGSGTFVSDAAPALLAQAPPAAPTVPAVSPAQLMEARLAIEPALIELVVRHATAADFAHMQQCCAQAEAATTLVQFEYWDTALHQAIGAAAHNAFVDQLMRDLSLAREQDDWGRLKRLSLTPARRASYQREHRALVQALSDRDAPAATRLLREHLVHVRRNLLDDPG